MDEEVVTGSLDLSTRSLYAIYYNEGQKLLDLIFIARHENLNKQVFKVYIWSINGIKLYDGSTAIFVTPSNNTNKLWKILLFVRGQPKICYSLVEAERKPITAKVLEKLTRISGGTNKTIIRVDRLVTYFC